MTITLSDDINITKRDSEELKRIVTRIKEIRIALGMTQSELAVKMGVSQATIGMWETGARMPRASKLQKLAKILGCTVSDLFAKEATG